MAKCLRIADALNVKCSNRCLPADQHHRHCKLFKCQSMRESERYPMPLVKVVLRAAKAELVDKGSMWALASPGVVRARLR